MMNEFSRSSLEFTLTEDMKAAFQRDGYIIIRQLFDGEEQTRLRESLESAGSVWDHSFAVVAEDGTESRLCVWSNPGDDVTGILARCEKMAGTCEKLLGGEVYHYHSKLMMKEAKTGGKFLWHQDYGYWYQNGNLFPNMMTGFVAVDECTKENGCLHVIPKSHQCGRLQHSFHDGQQGADQDRVDMILTQLSPIHVELKPGDVLFFHCNLLHCSGQNTSTKRRWAMLVAYNRKSNNPVIEHQHPRYRPLHKVPNAMLKTCPLTFSDPEIKEFMDPKTSKTLSRVKTANEEREKKH